MKDKAKDIDQFKQYLGKTRKKSRIDRSQRYKVKKVMRKLANKEGVKREYEKPWLLNSKPARSKSLIQLPTQFFTDKMSKY